MNMIMGLMLTQPVQPAICSCSLSFVLEIEAVQTEHNDFLKHNEIF